MRHVADAMIYNGWLWYEEERGGWTLHNISK